MVAIGNSYFILVDFQKILSSETAFQMMRNLIGSIYGNKDCSFRPDPLTYMAPHAILVSDWLISKKILFSETARPNELNLGRKHPCKVLYNKCSFFPIRL